MNFFKKRFFKKSLAKIILFSLFIILASLAIYFLTTTTIDKTCADHKLTTPLDSTGLSGYTLYKIPNTSLEVSIPSTFINDPDGRDAGIHADVTPAINLLRSKGTYVYATGIDKISGGVVKETISIYIEKSNLDPKNWLHENVTLQGEKLSLIGISEFSFNNLDVAYAYTSCCGGYTPTYVISHNNLQGDNIIVVFATNAMLFDKGIDVRGGGNYLLDALLLTLIDSANNL